MEVMISVNPPYSDLIISEYKPYEFRRRVLSGMDEGYPLEKITAFIYETKNKGGKGAVVGQVEVIGAYTVNYCKDTATTQELVNERFRCVKSLYLYWCEINNRTPNMNEGWFKSKRFKHYLREIGFIGENDSLNWNYALILNEPQKYPIARPLNGFVNRSGFPLVRPPQNMCSCSMIAM